jgi:hypothetical protein
VRACASRRHSHHQSLNVQITATQIAGERQ